MPNVGPLELAIVLIIALVIFGPRKLPELGRSLGSGMREFKESVTGGEAADEARQLGAGKARAGTRPDAQVDTALPDEGRARVNAP